MAQNVRFAHSIPVDPLEMAELVFVDREWPFDRVQEGEVVAEAEGKWGNLRLWLRWDDISATLHVVSSYEMKIPEGPRARVLPLLARINEQLFLGHFDLSSDDGSLCYRYGQRLFGGDRIGEAQIEELLDLATAECERYYPAFQMVLWAGQDARTALQLVLIEPSGHA